MRTINLRKTDHNVKIGDNSIESEPTLFEDSLFLSEGEPIGFYLARLPDKLENLVNISNLELNSNRVPKSEMKRSSGLFGNSDKDVLQYSCIIGSIPPKPHMRRSYASRSSVHAVEAVTPAVYKIHRDSVEKQVPEKWRFAKLFTSSISNCNIACGVHQDNLNVRGAINVIITKRRNSKGGNLFVPDYGTTFNSADNSMLVYPAWRNMHGVTPIVTTHPGGYRNSLIWYALNAFENH